MFPFLSVMNCLDYIKTLSVCQAYLLDFLEFLKIPLAAFSVQEKLVTQNAKPATLICVSRYVIESLCKESNLYMLDFLDANDGNSTGTGTGTELLSCLRQRVSLRICGADCSNKNGQLISFFKRLHFMCLLSYCSSYSSAS